MRGTQTQGLVGAYGSVGSGLQRSDAPLDDRPTWRRAVVFALRTLAAVAIAAFSAWAVLVWRIQI